MSADIRVLALMVNAASLDCTAFEKLRLLHACLDEVAEKNAPALVTDPQSCKLQDALQLGSLACLMNCDGAISEELAPAVIDAHSKYNIIP